MEVVEGAARAIAAELFRPGVNPGSGEQFGQLREMFGAHLLGDAIRAEALHAAAHIDMGFVDRIPQRIARIADAVVVGSRIIEEIEKSTAETACANVKALVADIRRGVDEVKK